MRTEVDLKPVRAISSPAPAVATLAAVVGNNKER
jgi:hypothetical protein